MGKVTGYYAEAEFTTPTLGDGYWAKYRQGMEVNCPVAFKKPFIWHGPTTGFGVVQAKFYRAGNVSVSIKRFRVTRPLGSCEVESIERVEYLRKERRAEGVDIIESTTNDPTGQTLRHRFRPGPSPANLGFLGDDAKGAAVAMARQMTGMSEVGTTTYLGFPAVRLESARLHRERVELADDPRVPADLRHAVMEETQTGPDGEITMKTRTLVLHPEEAFDAAMLAAPAVAAAESR